MSSLVSLIMRERKNSVKCIYCNRDIDDSTRSKEHIIQNALGGIYESTGICCSSCNNLVEKYIDKDFCKIFSTVLTQIPDLKKTNSTQLPSCEGVAMCPDGRAYNVTIKGKNVVDCLQMKKELRRNLTKSELGKLDIFCYYFNLGNKEFMNGICKIAFNYAIEKGIPYDKISHILSVTKDENKISEIKFKAPLIPFVPMNFFDYFLELETETELYHNLILFSYDKSLYCYIDLFNTFQFYVALCDKWEGDDVYESYFQLIQKIDRKLPEFTIKRNKHIINIATLYGVEPTYDLKKLYKDVQTVINKVPYEKDMGEYLTRKLSWQYLLSDCKEKILDEMASMLFYIDEYDALIEKRFRAFTPYVDSKRDGLKYCLYPDWITMQMQSGLNIREYTFKKFERLTKYLRNIRDE